MESRFAHLRQRDTSVSMLRVKMSRRRSQSLKENRERAVNTRRQLDKLPELEISSLDASIALSNMSTIQEKMNSTKVAKNLAVEERLKQLERWKERKALEKEKDKREKDRKGVFKTGMFHPTDTFVGALPAVQASTRSKNKMNTVPAQSMRVTRSMKQQQQVQMPLKMQDPNTVARKATVERSTRSREAPAKLGPAKTKTKVAKVEPVLRAPSTRSATGPPALAVPLVKDKPQDKSADVRNTRSRAFTKAVSPLPESKKTYTGTDCISVQPSLPEVSDHEMQEPEEKSRPPSPTLYSEEQVDQMGVDSIPVVDPVGAPSSFAPEGFVFQAPTGLSSFRIEPPSSCSADIFVTPSLGFSLPPTPMINAEPSEPSPPKSPRRSTRVSIAVIPATPCSPKEPKHDVSYFRSEIVNETDRLTDLSLRWEGKVEDESIPEEMRDRMRTAVGQARLLMKERFKQFSGLVDDCELGRGEKITTCTDLQGFWDMVYYQVEDVNKKFDALEGAKSRGWVDEQKPAPRQKKMVKKPSAVPAKPTGNKEAAKSRLAAVKAAMKARQQEAEKAAQEAGNDDEEEEEEEAAGSESEKPQPKAEPQPADSVVFDGGFFKVESPARSSMRRSSRLCAAVLPQASPCSNYLSPRRVTRRSLAQAQTPVHNTASPSQPIRTPAQLCLTRTQTPTQAQKSQRGTPQSSHKIKDALSVPLCFSPVKEVLSDVVQPKGSPACPSVTVVELRTPTLVHSPSSISVVEEQNEPARVSLNFSACKTPLSVFQSHEYSSCQSLTTSLLRTPSQPTISSCPAVEAQTSMCHTPNSTVVEEIPGLDFDRYLQPSARCSPSPSEAIAVEMHSPMVVDIEMESPRGQPEDLLTRQEAVLPAASSVLTPRPPQALTAESALLLFTPDLKDRIRQSVCPSDLMVFTPPL